MLFTLLLPLLWAPSGGEVAGEAPRVTQPHIQSGALGLDEVRAAGLALFSTPFLREDGFGDGPMNPVDPTSPGSRPTLQDNGTFLRVNGLDAQSCLECHAVGSNAVVPFRFAVGGAGASSSNAMFRPTDVDVDDEKGHGYASFDGRFINPPFLFGSGGVELVAREMTAELQDQIAFAKQNPGAIVHLSAKGVSFGSVIYNGWTDGFDTTLLEGIDEDFVVRPFGRKGEFATVREFDLEALPFHMGMQPVETVGANFDEDGDGVVNEVTIGEVSALHVFNTNLEAPVIDFTAPGLLDGFEVFVGAGCATCHVPAMSTSTSELSYAFPEDPLDPTSGVYLTTDLVAGPAKLPPDPFGGASVRMFSDLKRHDMGPELAESLGSELDSLFLTARLWGVADTAPYLHDGRALTLTEAIAMHGGEAQAASDAFVALTDEQRDALLAFLGALRTPEDPAADLLE